MTRRRFYAPPEAFSPDGRAAQLGVEETRHLRNVLRLERGDEIFLFDGAGREFQGRVELVARNSTEVTVIDQVGPAQPESNLNLTLAVSLLKGEKFDLVIQKATELGVTGIVPVITSRADVRLQTDADAERKMTRWERIALEATKQCGRARLMKIERPAKFSELVRAGDTESSVTRDGASEDACAPVTDVVKSCDVRIMFAERQGVPLSGVLNRGSRQAQTVIALIGPEGGWADDEIDQAFAAGWKIVTLGGRTLRAETAAIVAATLIQHRFGDLT
jgi:16S rRNA (uracil1498-N3)-methyltransferase